MRISHRLQFSSRKSNFVSLEQARQEIYLSHQSSQYSYSSNSVEKSFFWSESQEYSVVKSVRSVRKKVNINKRLNELWYKFATSKIL